MYDFPIYGQERKDGVDVAVRSSASIIYASLASVTDKFPISEKAFSRVSLWSDRAQAKLSDDDLHYLQSILVTVGWNKNDDVFDPSEVWIARHSPEHKQFNYEHNGADIIGHIVSCRPIDSDGAELADDSTIDSLPAKFHILTGGVLYKYWEKKELQARMDKTLAEIAKGEWFVSMECLFKGFDYALKAKDGKFKVVARNDQTAFLTKHLCAYGGTGVAKVGSDEYTVGRLLRNIVFSGKGLVRKPANPESVIFDHHTQAFVAAKAEILNNFKEEVYSSCERETNKQESDIAMAQDELQRQLDALKAENETLKASLKDNDLKSLTAAKDQAEANAKVATEAKATLEKDLADARKSVETLTANLADTEKGLAEVKDELSTIYANQKKATRLAKVKSALKVKDTDEKAVAAATKLNEALSGLSDEQFEAYISTQAELVTVTNNPADGNVSFPHNVDVKPVPKVTEGKEPPKVGTKEGTPDMGVPMKVDPPQYGMAEHVDPAEANADTNLDNAKQQAEAALSTVSASDGVNKLAEGVNAFFCAK